MSSSPSVRESLQEAGRYIGLGLQLALSMVFFTLGGYGLDVWLGTKPWLTVGGSLVGIAAVILFIARLGGAWSDSDGGSSKEERMPGERAPNSE